MTNTVWVVEEFDDENQRGVVLVAETLDAAKRYTAEWCGVEELDWSEYTILRHSLGWQAEFDGLTFWISARRS